VMAPSVSVVVVVGGGEVIVENFVVDDVVREVPSDNCSLITVEISSISSDRKVVDSEIFTFTLSICSVTTSFTRSMYGETVEMMILSLGTSDGFVIETPVIWSQTGPVFSPGPSRTQSVVVSEIDVAVSPWTSLALDYQMSNTNPQTNSLTRCSGNLIDSIFATSLQRRKTVHAV